MADEKSWDALMAELDALSAEFDTIRKEMSDENDNAGERHGRPASGLSSQGEGAFGKSDAAEKRDISEAALSPEGNGRARRSSGSAGSAPGELSVEDLQCYKIRRKYFGTEEDPALERMEAGYAAEEAQENAKKPPLSGKALFVSIGSELAGGKISDTAAEEMLRYKNSEDTADPGMRQFYPAFTVLQGKPSGQLLRETLAGIHSVPKEGEADQGLRILGNAIENEMRRQQQKDDQQDRNYQARRAEISGQKKQAEEDYQKAVRRTGRWR